MFEIIKVLIAIAHFFGDVFVEKNKHTNIVYRGSPYAQKTKSTLKIHFTWFFICGWLIFKLFSLAVDTVRLEKKYETAVASCTKQDSAEPSNYVAPTIKATKQQKIVTK